MEEPFRRRLEAVIFLEALERRLIEQPHPLVAPGKPCSDNRQAHHCDKRSREESSTRSHALLLAHES
jgi:hypothetical protein